MLFDSNKHNYNISLRIPRYIFPFSIPAYPGQVVWIHSAEFQLLIHLIVQPSLMVGKQHLGIYHRKNSG
jgi:hypothetical protein